MKLQRDPSGAIELLLWDMAAADIERITKMVLADVEPSRPISVTHIAGDAVNCAIGSGASLTVRDLVTLLQGRGDGDPAGRELLKRLKHLQSLDAELPERRTSAELTAERVSKRVAAELSARNLADPRSAEFGRSKYSKRQLFPNDLGESTPMRTAGTLFAICPIPLIVGEAKSQFLQWMDCNQRRYKPVDDCLFLPGLIPDAISRAHVWHNGQGNRLSSHINGYTTYLAVELEGGYVEYGFCPGSFFEPDQNKVYYAKVVAGFYAFLTFIRDVSIRFGIDPSEISAGMAIRGTSGTRLTCISKGLLEHQLGGASPSEDGLRWVNAATPGLDWSPDHLARQAALDVLDHWSFAIPACHDTPEFTNEKYTGKYYLADFHHQWY